VTTSGCSLARPAENTIGVGLHGFLPYPWAATGTRSAYHRLQSGLGFAEVAPRGTLEGLHWRSLRSWDLGYHLPGSLQALRPQYCDAGAHAFALWPPAEHNCKPLERDEYVKNYFLKLAPLPCWKHLTTAQRRRKVEEMIAEVEAEAAAVRFGWNS